VTLVLRPYQRAAVDAVFDWVSRYEGNPLLVVPTGGGKSPIMGSIIAQVLDNAPTARCLVLAHRKELLQQNVRAISTVVPFTMVGIYSAGLKTKDTASPVIVAGIQSVASKPYALGAFDVVLIDEAHLVPLSDDTSYRKVIKALRTMNPNVRFIGLTATPYRLNTGLLHRGKNPLFTDIAYEVPVRDLIEQGFLCPLISKATIKRLDTTGVATRGGEYVAGELERAVDVDDVTTAVVEEMTRLFAGRNKWLVFCAGVQHAEHVATALMLNGVMAAPVHGTLDAMTRAERLDAFKRGELRCLTSMDVLTTGYDEPAIDAIALLRPTKSAGLYVQMVGRGFRLHPDKANCLAEGQRVLTDAGLVPIERVTTAMRLWDGVQWVSHSGVVYKGKQEVITYAGLTATPDHRVVTAQGWQTFGKCAMARTPIAVAGDGRHAVREADGHFRGCDAERSRAASAPARAMQWLQCAVAAGVHKSDQGDGRMSSLRESAPGAEVAGETRVCGTATLHEPEEPTVHQLRSSRHRVPLHFADSHGHLDSAHAGSPSSYGDRSSGQQRTLRRGEPAVRHLAAAEGQHATRRETAHVYDIVNAGPRHRFVVEGLLVSNCLVLDFAGNVEYFGPVDTIKVHEKKPGDGKPPTKKCPICSEICAAGVRLCPACQFEFPEPEKPPIVPEASTRPILSTEPEPIEELKVDDVMYSRHEKEGKPPSLRVDYLVGYRIAASEWICLEHTGFARTKAEQWWKLRSNDPPPATIAEALLYVDELPVPTAIKTQRDGRFTRVVAATLPPKPEPPAFPRACWSCAFYSAAKDCCQKWDATPPEDVKKVGCEAWTEEEVPF
jgi:superfamily II DNA or RNA helicase